MGRTIATVNAKSRAEAILGLEMLLEAVKAYDSDSLIPVKEKAVVTNEGKSSMRRVLRSGKKLVR